MNTLYSKQNKNLSHIAPRRIDLFSQLSKEIDHAVNEVFGAPFFSGLNVKNKGYPLVDAISTTDSLILQYALPGVKSEDINVEITEDEFGQVLSISGKLSSCYRYNEKEYHIKELSNQEFRRVIRLPEDVDTKDPLTILRDGILTLTFGLINNNTKENTKIRKISIKE